MKITFDSKIKQLTFFVRKVHKKQIPFAASKSMNNTLKNLRAFEVNKVYPRSFTVRRPKYFTSVMRIQFTKKKQLYGRLYQRTLTTDLQGFTSEGSGIRRPVRPHTQASSFSIPIQGTKAWNRRPLRATSPWRVRNLLNKKPTGRNQGFIRKDGNQKILYVRKNKGKTKRQREAADYITPMYVVGVRRVRLNTNQFPFYRKGKKFVRKDFPKEFRKEMRAAIRTAR